MDPRITDSTLIALGGLIAVVALLFLLITRFRWHVFIALLTPVLLFALVPGINREVFIAAFEQGFGRTVQSIAVVIVVVLGLAWRHFDREPAEAGLSAAQVAAHPLVRFEKLDISPASGLLVVAVGAIAFAVPGLLV